MGDRPGHGASGKWFVPQVPHPDYSSAGELYRLGREGGVHISGYPQAE